MFVTFSDSKALAPAAAATRTFSLTPFISSSSFHDEASPRPATATAGNGPTPQNIREEPPLMGPPLQEKKRSFHQQIST